MLQYRAASVAESARGTMGCFVIAFSPLLTKEIPSLLELQGRLDHGCCLVEIEGRRVQVPAEQARAEVATRRGAPED